MKPFLMGLGILLLINQAPAATCKSWQVTYSNPLPGVDRSKTLRNDGIATDVMKAISKRLSCPLASKEKPQPQALLAFEKGKTAIFALTTRTDNMDQIGTFVPLYNIRRGLIVRREYFEPGKIVPEYLRDNKIHFSDVSGNRPYLTKDEEQALVSGKRLLQAATYKDAITMLKNGSVQAVFAAPLAYQSLMKKNQMSKEVEYIEDQKFILTEGLYFSNVKLTPVEKISLQDAITAIKEDGTLRKILATYLRQEDVDNDLK